jgi:hypothetical protein
MSFFGDITNTVVNVVKDAIGAIGGVAGKITSDLATVGYDFAGLVNVTTSILQNVSAKVLPEEVAKWVSIQWFLVNTAANYGPAFLQNLSNAIKTGKILEIFNVITPAVVAAARDARDQARKGSRPLPKHISDMIPDQKDRYYVADAVQYTTVKENDQKFFFIWRHFSGGTVAITLGDTIIFVKEPDFTKLDDQFTTLHEIKHTLQYRKLGIDQFIYDYLDSKAKSQTPGFELEADMYACSIIPNGHPVYIPRCM